MKQRTIGTGEQRYLLLCYNRTKMSLLHVYIDTVVSRDVTRGSACARLLIQRNRPVPQGIFQLALRSTTGEEATTDAGNPFQEHAPDIWNNWHVLYKLEKKCGLSKDIMNKVKDVRKRSSSLGTFTGLIIIDDFNNRTRKGPSLWTSTEKPTWPSLHECFSQPLR
jgi:hypothetical protein